jgi:hypothetical protein
MNGAVLVLLIFGILWAALGINAAKNQRAAYVYWQPVPATIKTHLFEAETRSIDNPAVANVLGDSVTEGLREHAESRNADAVDVDTIDTNVHWLVYEYRFDNQWYESRTAYFHQGQANEALLDEYPIHQPVTAYVNPVAPENSFLISAPSFGGYALILISLWIFSLASIVGRGSFPVDLTPYSLLCLAAGSLCIVHYALLRGPFALSAALLSAGYLVISGLPLFWPWLKNSALPAIALRLEPVFGSVSADHWATIGFTTFVGVLLLILVVFPIWWAASSASLAGRFHQSFIPVSATVIVSEVRKTYHPAGEKTPAFYSYWPEVKFSYKVDGQHYETGLLEKSPDTSDRVTEEMKGVLDRYPIGSEHEIRYDPENPYVAYAAMPSPQEIWSALAKYGLWLLIILFALPIVAILATIAMNAIFGGS